ncbi:hypothetical protein DY000_02020435 [Brassica cretica]|uniref:CST complex subunit TEN1 n=1 Tax=Brassica cretica TaxID=69181 RepID=A0ABQ7ELU0_BRACR|nr:hypothetical protein DY000_02020435 [Brassica cretica]
MANSQIESGAPITLQELYPSSPFFMEARSLRVTGLLKGYSVETAIGVIEDGEKSLKINTQHLRDVSFRVGSVYQFLGELHIEPNNERTVAMAPPPWNPEASLVSPRRSPSCALPIRQWLKGDAKARLGDFFMASASVRLGARRKAHRHGAPCAILNTER